MKNEIENLMVGEKLYQQRARKALPIMVDCVINKEKITYSDLATKIGVTNPRNLNWVLGSIGAALKELENKWGEYIPPINSIVTNKNTGFPSDGIAWFLDKDKFDSQTSEQKRDTVNKLFDEVFHYDRWLEILNEFNLKPVSSKSEKIKNTNEINKINTDNLEQEELEREIKDEKPEKIREMLKSIVEAKEVCVEFKGKLWKRNNAIVSFIKKNRGYKCQICGYSIKKKDGSYYIEGAHIIAKNTGKGKETPDNIVVLCPNHHKEFDLGDREIIKHTREALVFKMNGKEYEVDLSIR